MNARYACAAGCDFRAPLTEVVYRCPRCDGLLEVEHDVAALRARHDAAGWKALFARRNAEARLPQSSGIWSKREWVLPDLADADIVSLGEGRAPLLPLPRMAEAFRLGMLELKQCGISPTGSFKDLGMTVLVSQVRAMRRDAAPIRAIACASTGDTSAALAAYCAAAGLPCVVLLPRDKVTISQLVQPIASGATVLSLDTDFDGCMRVVRELTADRTIYLANSLNSLRLEGQKIVAVELCEQLGWKAPDWIVVPGGNLGNVSAIAAGLTLAHTLGLIDRLPRLAVAQAAKANPLARAFRAQAAGVTPLVAERTLASAIQIGDPVSAPRALRALARLQGVVEDATEQELSDAAARADLEGSFTDPHTGVALAVVEKLARAGTLAAGSHVVVISTAHGLKFPDFKVGYHRGGLPEVSAGLPNPPVEVPATISAVQEVLRRRLDSRDRFA